jgi:hypothetical protein
MLMAEVNDIDIHRDGGTIEFRVAGSDIDGLYRLQTPFLGVPEPLLKDGRRLDFGSADEVAVLNLLREWLARVSTAELHSALTDLNQLKDWRNRSPELDGAIPLHRIDTVVRKLSARCTCV